MSYANLKILGNPISNAGWQTLLTIGEANFIVEDNNYGISTPEFYSFRIENGRVVYVLHKTNVSSVGSGRDGSLKIAISIPKGYKLLNTNPYLLLNELTDEFIKKYMKQKIEKYEYLPQSTAITEADFINILSKYELTETRSAYRPRDLQAKEVGRLVLSEDKTEALLTDVHYKEFCHFSNIVISTVGETTPQLSNITIPRVPEYTIKQDHIPTTTTKLINETIQYQAYVEPSKKQLYDNPIYEFSIKELLEGKPFKGITLDSDNEEISINIQPILKPVKIKTDATTTGKPSISTKTNTTKNDIKPQPPITVTTSDSIKLTITSNNRNFIDESPIIIHLCNHESADDTDYSNIRQLRQPVFFKQENQKIQAQVNLSEDWDKECLYGYVENRKKERINLTFKGAEYTKLSKGNAVEATATDIYQMPLIDKIKKFAIPSIIALIAILLIGVGFAAGYFIPKKNAPQEMPTGIRQEGGVEQKTSKNASDSVSEKYANVQQQQQQTQQQTQEQKKPDYSKDFIAWNEILNKDNVTFAQIEQIYSEFNSKKENDTIFKAYIKDDPEDIIIGSSKHKPSFFITKIDTYNKAADWVKDKNYNAIEKENAKDSKYKYPNMESNYHKQCMERITLGTYKIKNGKTQLVRYKSFQKSVIEDKFRAKTIKFNSFKELEKKLKLE